MSQCLDLDAFKPAFSLWMQVEFEMTPLAVPDGTTSGKCCYQGCCEPEQFGQSGMVTVCGNGHVMHPNCFVADLGDKMKFRNKVYICYQCDDRSLDVLYRSLLCNSNFENVFPMALTSAGASVFSVVQALAVGNEEYTRFYVSKKAARSKK
jgi:hypothetical protein